MTEHFKNVLDKNPATKVGVIAEIGWTGGLGGVPIEEFS